MSGRSSHNYRRDGNRGFNQTQQNSKYVPKTQNPSKPDPPPTTSTPTPTPPPPRVRVGDNGNWVSNRNQGGNFVNYLPQDEAVATGLGVEHGALDPVESQRVVDLLNRELARLLKLNPKDFWRQVAGDASLHDFLDSFLQFRKRWYDFPHHGAKGLVAGVIVGEIDLSRRVFVVLYRISSNRDPGAKPSDGLSAKEHGALLGEKKLLDLSKLLDICAVYGNENPELTKVLVNNAMQAQPLLHENLSGVVSRFLSVVQTMHQRCDSLLGRDDHGGGQLSVDFLEVMDFINDAVVSLDSFVDAYKPAALYFSCPVETSYGSAELLGTLARLHDLLLPCLQLGFGQRSTDGDGGGKDPDSVTNFKILSMRIISLFWKLLDVCYLRIEVFEECLPHVTTTKMYPSSVEDPMIRGDILVQTFREINAEVSRHSNGVKCNVTVLQKVENIYNLLHRIDELQSMGWISLETDQFDYLRLILMPPSGAITKDFNGSTSVGNNVQVDENAAITESKISQIKDLFPDYGKGFLAACLEAYNQNPEEVIQRILEGTLHEELQSMDISLDTIPPPKSASSSRMTDKGKGLLQDQSLSQPVAAEAKRQTVVTSSSSSSSPLVGRYTRKTKTDLPYTKTLDSRSDVASKKTSILASQYEYEDEYDDSFDELGLSVVGSGYEEAESTGERIRSGPMKSGGSETENPAPSKSGPKWNAKKTPQFYVKDGKNYSYKVSGAVAVSDSREAAIVNQAQKEVINGLGRGGNLPLGAVQVLAESNEQQDQVFDGTETGGRGNPASYRGRGRRGGGGGGRNHNRKDRAIRKHFAGLGGGF